MGGDGGLEEGSRAPATHRPTREPVRLSGALSTTAIRSVIRGALVHFRRCYEETSTAGEEFHGRGRLSFTISPDGTVTEATFDLGNDGGNPLAACLVGVVLQLRFEPRIGGGAVRVTYPLVFRSD